MTEATTPKKPGRPRKAVPPVATTPQESPVAESNPDSGTKVLAEPEIDTQRPEADPQRLPTITVEELIDGMDQDLVFRVEMALARHMVRDHRMTWGETRVSLGYGLQGQDDSIDAAWVRIFTEAQK